MLSPQYGNSFLKYSTRTCIAGYALSRVIPRIQPEIHFGNPEWYTEWSEKQVKQLSRKLKSRYGARNRFREPSLELVAKQHRLAGQYDNPVPTWFLDPIAGLMLPTLSGGFAWIWIGIWFGE